MRISDWSSDVCSSDLPSGNRRARGIFPEVAPAESVTRVSLKSQKGKIMKKLATAIALAAGLWAAAPAHAADGDPTKQAILQHYGDLAQAMYGDALRSEEHTSALQSLMRISSAVFCLKKKKITLMTTYTTEYHII